jgi:hypothetical protein
VRQRHQQDEDHRQDVRHRRRHPDEVHQFVGHRNQYRLDEHLEQAQFADHQEVAEPGDPKRSSDGQAAAELDDQLR